MSGEAAAAADGGRRFVALYDSALPYVYGYLLARCGRTVLAEELTADTMLAAVDALQRGRAQHSRCSRRITAAS